MFYRVGVRVRWRVGIVCVLGVVGVDPPTLSGTLW